MVNKSTTEEIRKFYKLSLELADLAEDILESRGDYSDDFIQGLNASREDERAGRMKKINSLTELK